jgi:methyl-accepting chemotaxis protein
MIQRLRNLPLAARLGVAFGALALGLLVVALVAFRATDGLRANVDALAVDVPDYTATVDGLAARLPEEAHLTVRHLYEFDGDLKAQDEVEAEFEKRAKADEAALARMRHILSATDDPATTEAAIVQVAGVAETSSASAEQVSATTQEMSASAQEIASSAQELARTAEDLERLVNQFKVV